MSNEGSQVVIASAIALIGVLASAIISSSISKRSAYLAAVTAERSKWIEKLRSNIAELAGICNYVHMKLSTDMDYASSAELDEMIRRIEHLAAMIRLQLNPNGKIDQNIIEIILKMPLLATQKRDVRIFSADLLLVSHAQWLLKEEWETVKSEAAGLPMRCIIAYKRRQRAKAYKAFCEHDGSLEPLEAEPSAKQDGLQ